MEDARRGSDKAEGGLTGAKSQERPELLNDLKQKEQALETERGRYEKLELKYIKLTESYQTIKKKLDKREGVITKALNRLEVIFQSIKACIHSNSLSIDHQ